MTTALLVVTRLTTPDLYDAERNAPTHRADPIVLRTTPQGYADALALIGEWWGGALVPATLSFSAPYPATLPRVVIEPQEPGGFVPEPPPEWNPDAPTCEWCGAACPNGSDYAPWCSKQCQDAGEGRAADFAGDAHERGEHPPEGKRHPITSAESQHYIDSGEWPDDDGGDEGCPVGDPDCVGSDGDCHDACEAPDGVQEGLMATELRHEIDAAWASVDRIERRERAIAYLTPTIPRALRSA